MKVLEEVVVYAPTLDKACRELEQTYSGSGCVIDVLGDEDSGVWTFVLESE